MEDRFKAGYNLADNAGSLRGQCLLSGNEACGLRASQWSRGPQLSATTRDVNISHLTVMEPQVSQLSLSENFQTFNFLTDISLNFNVSFDLFQLGRFSTKLPCWWEHRCCSVSWEPSSTTSPSSPSRTCLASRPPPTTSFSVISC